MIVKRIIINIYQMGETEIKTPGTMSFPKIGEKLRLMAEGGKTLTDGLKRTRIVEVSYEEETLWQEVELTEEEKPKPAEVDNTNYKELLDIITGEVGDDE